MKKRQSDHIVLVMLQKQDKEFYNSEHRHFDNWAYKLRNRDKHGKRFRGADMAYRYKHAHYGNLPF